jgi:hypothetical protein
MANGDGPDKQCRLTAKLCGDRYATWAVRGSVGLGFVANLKRHE